MATFAERLKFLRTERELTRLALSNLIGISHSSINMYERGEREPGLETLEIIADYFNVDMDYLLGRQDIPRKIDLSDAMLSIENPDASNITELTSHEHDVISAYRAHPEMQPAVDKILGVWKKEKSEITESTNSEEDFEYIELVARGGKYKVKKEDVVAWVKQMDLDDYEEDHDLG